MRYSFALRPFGIIKFRDRNQLARFATRTRAHGEPVCGSIKLTDRSVICDLMAFISLNARFAEHRTRLVCLGVSPSPRVRCLLACFTYLLTYRPWRAVSRSGAARLESVADGRLTARNDECRPGNNYNELSSENTISPTPVVHT